MATIVWHSQLPRMKKLEMGSIDSPRFSTSSSVSRIVFGICGQVEVCENLISLYSRWLWLMLRSVFVSHYVCGRIAKCR